MMSHFSFFHIHNNSYETLFELAIRITWETKNIYTHTQTIGVQTLPQTN